MMAVAFLRSRLALVLLVLALLVLLASLSVFPLLHHWALGGLIVDPNVISHNH